MSSAYTAIEADEPINQHTAPPPAYTTSPPITTPQPQAQPQTQSSDIPDSWVQRLKQSSHPIALLFYIFFRLSPIFIYIFGNFFIGFFTSTNKFILHFITLLLLVCGDFWNLKNISGRLLVGLRWWNETTPIDGAMGEFENVWVFETADPNRYINPIDSKMFWLLLYGQPVAWGVLGLLAVLKFQFLYLMVILISISLSM
ncbi:Golgi apparatus membrane protein TVP23 [Spathaspora sp. JA1]|nr:Golgi apparatus membrane protein TVP23 [Spathaspora sp. JA1]